MFGKHAKQTAKKKSKALSTLDFLWYHRESNQGHKDFQSFALPTELWYLAFCGAKVALIFLSRKFFW